jgi:hypothetical protein
LEDWVSVGLPVAETPFRSATAYDDLS